ncbi:WYL domain-containing protein [Clostridium chromiireducens]|uniref:WYL domain-containing protein n=1 Tax=Clostridium chromiireducens TaxID=225345 RepID=A0A964RQF4_9CLOT|nr:WYL domain-containing protein [Clostridium chromiireducens]MVX65936.1 WYL domain-containing protein [Clostridium chromiireducens]
MKIKPDNKNDKSNRILVIYDILRRGCIVKKKELSEKFRVNIRTIQRDLEEIRIYLSDNYDNEELIYDYEKRGYKIENQNLEMISSVEIFAFIKILIESRAFCKEEMEGLLISIISIIGKQEQKVIKNLVKNEIFHFQPLSHKKPILKIMWDIGQCILRKEIIEIKFKKMDGEEKKRVVYPLAIVFSEFYFYLVAQIEAYEDKEPAFFRLDRIDSFKMLNRKFIEKKRFEDGELKKRVLFMYGGEPIHLKFIYRGQAIEAILDRFPTAKIQNQSKDTYLIEANVYGKGCLIWLLSQGDSIELISPEELRKEIKNKIENMKNIYEE